MKKHRIQVKNGPTATGTARKCWNIVTAADMDSAEITLYGDICSSQPTDWWTGEPLPGTYITPEGFLDDLALIKDKNTITVKINSGGGDLYTGIAIHNALKGLKGKKVVVVEGLAASAASVIACAGDEVQMYAGSVIMIHGVAVGLMDYVTAEDIKKIAKNIEAANNAIAQIYHAKTGIEIDTLRSMMKAETWLVGKDAVEKKFADTLLGSEGPSMKLSADRKMLLVAGVRHDVRAFHNIPGTIPVEQDAPAAAAAHKKSPEGKQGGSSMTEQELREQHPDLVAAIEKAAVEAHADAVRTEAVEAERARLKAIDEIAPAIGDEKLVTEAKYGKETCSAETLAFRAVQKQAKLGSTFLDSLEKESKNSGAQNVTATPNSGNTDEGDADAAEFAGMVAAYKARSGGKK